MASIKDWRHLKGLKPVEPDSGVYFLCLRGEIVYVGQSINPMVRVQEHRRRKSRGFVFDKAFVVPCHRKHLDLVESAFIHLLQPAKNDSLRAPISLYVLAKARIPNELSCDLQDVIRKAAA